MSSPEQIQGLPAIADSLGVSVKTVKRRLNEGLWPEVEKVDGTHGGTWSVTRAGLGSIAEREGRVIDLRAGQGQPNPTLSNADIQTMITEALGERVTDASAIAEANAAKTIAEAERDRQVALTTRANKDLEAAEAENGRLATDLGESDKIRAVAEALATERLRMLEESQALVADADDRAEASFKQAALAESSLGWWGRRRLAKKTESNPQA